MRNDRGRTLRRVLAFVAAVLILKVTVAVVAGYRNYIPPDFDSDFLRGRESYFYASYRPAFYTHILTGPLTLFLGLLLVSDKFRLRFPAWHRILGRVQVACVLAFVTPSGLWMARYAASGPVAGVGFAILSFLTAACTAMGWRTAVARRFAEHRRWMWRSFLLLCSAVVLRVLGGFATVTGIDAAWYDLVASWASWILPISLFEWNGLRRARRSDGTSRRPRPVSTKEALGFGEVPSESTRRS